MNWKLILQLSLFGLIMAFGTLSLIPQKFEIFFWIVIFIICAYIIAKRCTGQYFLNGFMVSIFNCIWITAVHIIFCSTYLLNHPSMMAMNKNIPSLAIHPRLGMAIMGPIAGILSGIILGLFAVIAAKLVDKSVPKVQV